MYTRVLEASEAKRVRFWDFALGFRESRGRSFPLIRNPISCRMGGGSPWGATCLLREA